MPAAYPSRSSDRDAWILSRRSQRNRVDAGRPYAAILEEERAESGEIVSVATLFLTNRECPWKCLMCDLWKNTLTETVPLGAIPAQIDFGLQQLAAAQAGRIPRQIKLYNSGSFFDPRAIPPSDDAPIAERVRRFSRVIVESHPALVGERAVRFRELLDGSAALEVAMGLETVHPAVLERLNKRVTIADFARAAGYLREHDIDLRVFVLVKPPFLDESAALEWACHSIDFALDCGATVVSAIPTRGGNGAMEALAEAGEFSPPQLATLEAAVEHGMRQGRARVFADLWDLPSFSRCATCFADRRDRLARMNLTQVVEPAIQCPACGMRHED